jgi:hypothetical protein
VQTVPRIGWAGKRNGELLSLAAAQFDVFVTVDRDLPKQHDISQYDLAIVVLVARSNRLADLQPLVAKLLATLNTAKSGEAVEIS